MKKTLFGIVVLNLIAVSSLGVTKAFAAEKVNESNLDSSLVKSSLLKNAESKLEQVVDTDNFNPHVFEETKDAMVSAEKENLIAQKQADQIVGGTAYFSDYGIENDSVPCDDAFEKMINSPKVTKIVATSNLLFQKRHVITRNNLEIDFGNYEIRNGDMEDAATNDPFAAVLIFKGDNQGEKQQVTLKEEMKLFQEIFEVQDSSQFELYDYYRVHVNAKPGEVGKVGKQEKEIDKMIMVTEIIDDTHVKFNYRMGWEIEAGRILTYDKVEPVRNVLVRNAKYFNTGKGELDSASLVSFEYVVEGNISDVESYHTYWPAIMRRHNTHYYTVRTKLYNPIEVIVGGTGYLTQQIHTLYGTVKDNQTSAARHLNDFTGSAYCVVENNHATNDYHGGFVTHGQFEHDLTYLNNTGLLSFANSGLTWGESARRISVKKHYGSWVIARTKITDLTLEDVEVHAEDYYPDSGKFLINADGAQLKGVTGDGIIFTQRSNRSRRPTSVEGSSFKKEDVVITKEGPNAVTTDIIFKDFTDDSTESTTTDSSSSTDSTSSESTSETSSSSDSTSSESTSETSSTTDSTSSESISETSSTTDSTSSESTSETSSITESTSSESTSETSSTTDSASSESTSETSNTTDSTSETSSSTSSTTSGSTSDTSSTTDSTSDSTDEKLSESDLIKATTIEKSFAGDVTISGKTLSNTEITYQLESTTRSQKDNKVTSDKAGKFILEFENSLKSGDVVLLKLTKENVTTSLKHVVLEKPDNQQNNNNSNSSNTSNNEKQYYSQSSSKSDKILPKTGERISTIAPIGLLLALFGVFFFIKTKWKYE